MIWLRSEAFCTSGTHGMSRSSIARLIAHMHVARLQFSRAGSNFANFVASVPGLPRYAIYCARLIVRGRETLKTGDETSRAHRRWVDAGSRAPRCLDHNYV